MFQQWRPHSHVPCIGSFSNPGRLQAFGFLEGGAQHYIGKRTRGSHGVVGFLSQERSSQQTMGMLSLRFYQSCSTQLPRSPYTASPLTLHGDRQLVSKVCTRKNYGTTFSAIMRDPSTTCSERSPLGSALFCFVD
jgi:hypothetical protein